MNRIIDKICHAINHLIERFFFAALLWIKAGPDRPWSEED